MTNENSSDGSNEVFVTVGTEKGQPSFESKQHSIPAGATTMTGPQLLALARGYLVEGRAVQLVVDGRDDPIKVYRISAPDGNGVVSAFSDGPICQIHFRAGDLIDVYGDDGG